MTWRYFQSTGVMAREHLGATPTYLAQGYSGYGDGKNDHVDEGRAGIGPIPCGRWTITEKYDSPNVGPYALKLEPKPGTDTRGRSAFRIHGDSVKNPGAASHGCIILLRAARVAIWESGDRDLEVVP